MGWDQVLSFAGLNEREVQSVLILSSKPKLKASELPQNWEQQDLMPTTLFLDYKK